MSVISSHTLHTDYSAVSSRIAQISAAHLLEHNSISVAHTTLLQFQHVTNERNESLLGKIIRVNHDTAILHPLEVEHLMKDNVGSTEHSSVAIQAKVPFGRILLDSHLVAGSLSEARSQARATDDNLLAGTAGSAGEHSLMKVDESILRELGRLGILEFLSSLVPDTLLGPHLVAGLRVLELRLHTEESRHLHTQLHTEDSILLKVAEVKVNLLIPELVDSRLFHLHDIVLAELFRSLRESSVHRSLDILLTGSVANHHESLAPGYRRHTAKSRTDLLAVYSLAHKLAAVILVNHVESKLLTALGSAILLIAVNLTDSKDIVGADSVVIVSVDNRSGSSHTGIIADSHGSDRLGAYTVILDNRRRSLACKASLADYRVNRSLQRTHLDHKLVNLLLIELIISNLLIVRDRRDSLLALTAADVLNHTGSHNSVAGHYRNHQRQNAQQKSNHPKTI